jgi:hypothetical protein
LAGALFCRIAREKNKKGNLLGPSAVFIDKYSTPIEQYRFWGGGNENGLFIPAAYLNCKYSDFRADIN